MIPEIRHLAERLSYELELPVNDVYNLISPVYDYREDD